MNTPANLSREKKTLDDLPASVYDHHSQTRRLTNGNAIMPVSDTQFDGEKS
jgi:hypothetical protein